jgi:hypothetical protein
LKHCLKSLVVNWHIGRITLQITVSKVCLPPVYITHPSFLPYSQLKGKYGWYVFLLVNPSTSRDLDPHQLNEVHTSFKLTHSSTYISSIPRNQRLLLLLTQSRKQTTGARTPSTPPSDLPALKSTRRYHIPTTAPAIVRRS